MTALARLLALATLVVLPLGVPTATRPAAVPFDADVRWLGLDVRTRRVIDDAHAEVEFVARQRDATGLAHRLHEKSRFERDGERWFYRDGDQV